MAEFLHERHDFAQLVSIVAEGGGSILSWSRRTTGSCTACGACRPRGYRFELKGGTSLSKGFGVIHRFSEDIDIRIEPPADAQLKVGRHHVKPAHVAARRDFYDWLAGQIRIPCIVQVERDTFFDDDKM